MGNYQTLNFEVKERINYHINNEKNNLNTGIVYKTKKPIKTTKKENLKEIEAFTTENSEIVFKNCYSNILKYPITVIQDRNNDFSVPVENLTLEGYYESLYENSGRNYLLTLFPKDYLSKTKVINIKIDSIQQNFAKLFLESETFNLFGFQIKLLEIRINGDAGYPNEKAIIEVKKEDFIHVFSESLHSNLELSLNNLNYPIQNLESYLEFEELKKNIPNISECKNSILKGFLLGQQKINYDISLKPTLELKTKDFEFSFDLVKISKSNIEFIGKELKFDIISLKYSPMFHDFKLEYQDSVNSNYPSFMLKDLTFIPFTKENPFNIPSILFEIPYRFTFLSIDFDSQFNPVVNKNLYFRIDSVGKNLNFLPNFFKNPIRIFVTFEYRMGVFSHELLVLNSHIDLPYFFSLNSGNYRLMTSSDKGYIYSLINSIKFPELKNLKQFGELHNFKIDLFDDHPFIIEFYHIDMRNEYVHIKGKLKNNQKVEIHYREYWLACEIIVGGSSYFFFKTDFAFLRRKKLQKQCISLENIKFHFE